MTMKAKQLLESKQRGYHLAELVVLGGNTTTDLLERMEPWLRALETAAEGCGLLKQLAYDSHRQFDGTPNRLRVALTAYSEGDLHKKLTQMRKMIVDRPEDGFSFPAAGLFYGTGAIRAKISFLFPGQGSQYLGMGKALADAFPGARRVWDTLGRMRFGAKSITEMVFPADSLSDEEKKWAFLELCGADWASPSIAVAGEAILSLLEALGVQPDAIGSHSFGDIAALRAAHVISGEDMLKAIRYRGDLGVSCTQATRGCILMVPEDASRIKAELARQGVEQVWIANHNWRNQTVLSGLKAGISKAHEVFQAQGINSRLIPISAAPHCPLAYNVSERFFDHLRDVPFANADFEVYSNLFGRSVKNDPDLFRKMLKAHAEKPVRFLRQIEQMHQDGVRIFIEVGPSDVLTQLVGQILEGKEHIALSTDQRKKDGVLVFLNAIAELFKENRIKDLSPLWEGYRLPSHAGLETHGRGLASVAVEKYLSQLDLEFAKIEKGYRTAQAI
jgi:acyl transferase domain-containing protein